jgi:NUMOD4 motif/HNH endonuclease
MAAQKMVEREKWCSIPGFNGRYEASTEGRIRNASTLRVLRHHPDGRGYMQVRISQEYGIACLKSYKVHRLVMVTFETNSNNLPQIDHINGIKSDNSLRNLEYVTVLENQQRAWDLGLNDHLKVAVYQYDKDNQLIKKHNSAASASKELGVLGTHIVRVARGRRQSAGGFVFKYHSPIEQKWIRLTEMLLSRNSSKITS